MLTHIKFDKENFFTCLNIMFNEEKKEIYRDILEKGLTEVSFVLKGKGRRMSCELITLPTDGSHRQYIRLLLSCQNDDAIVVRLRYNKEYSHELTGTVYNKDSSQIENSFCFMDNLKNNTCYLAPITPDQFLDKTGRKVVTILDFSFLT